MHHSLRSVAALSCLGWVTLFGLHGCSSRLGSVQATQNGGSIDRPNLPDISVEQFRECMADYGRQLVPGRIVLRSTINVNEDGDKQGSDIDGIPQQASDFGACMRNALREMPIAEQPFEDAVRTLRFHRKHAMESDDAFIQYLELISGSPIAGSTLVLEADGYAVEFVVTVNVVPKLQNVIDDDKRTIEKLGQMALGSLGYEEIMKRAELLGWINTVAVAHALSPARKALVAQGVAVAHGGDLIKLFTKYALKAGIASQVDSPAPGPGDLVALGILVVGLIHVGALTAQQLLAAQQVEAQRCREVKEKCIDHCSGPAGLPAPGGGRFRGCMRECMEAQGCSY